MLMIAKSGKYDGYLLEGMGCPGGCIGGAGSLAATKQAQTAVEKAAKNSDKGSPFESDYKGMLEKLEEA